MTLSFKKLFILAAVFLMVDSTKALLLKNIDVGEMISAPQVRLTCNSATVAPNQYQTEFYIDECFEHTWFDNVGVIYATAHDDQHSLGEHIQIFGLDFEHTEDHERLTPLILQALLDFLQLKVAPASLQITVPRNLVKIVQGLGFTLPSPEMLLKPTPAEIVFMERQPSIQK